MFKAAVLSLSLWILPTLAHAGDAGFGVKIIMDVASHGPTLETRLTALQALATFADKNDVLELGRELAMRENESLEITAAALQLIHKHFVRSEENKSSPIPRALEIINELWEMNGQRLLWRLVWTVTAGPALEDFIVDTLKYCRFEQQKLAMDLAGNNVHLLRSPRIDLEIKRIGETAQYAKQRQISNGVLERRELARVAKGIAATTDENLINEVFEVARKFGAGSNRDAVETAVESLGHLFSAAQHNKSSARALAQQRIVELWEQRNPSLPNAQRAILRKLGQLNEPFIEKIFLDALDSDNLHLQQLALENSTSGTMLAASEKIDAVLASLLGTVEYPRLLASIHATQAARALVRKSQAPCANTVVQSE